ncbi:MAG: class I SAM-dependent methyltransferase [Chloroflexota bacterium]|nr:MAG: class I SAM-dependent methyltransferase [Chloroflexota bacterium]
MPDYKSIYNQHASQYDLMVSREDYQNNISGALQHIAPLENRDVIELGAGTGRLTMLLAPLARSLRAFDVSGHMLQVAVTKLQAAGWSQVQTGVADHRSLPAPDRSADIVISGWSVCYMVVDYPSTWEQELGRALGEMKRVLRPGGTLIILETLGTGFESPTPPDSLKPYYAYLEKEGFASTWMRTDYRFESLDEAVTLARFFFGDGLAQKVLDQNWVILPECTGLWWLRV